MLPAAAVTDEIKTLLCCGPYLIRGILPSIHPPHPHTHTHASRQATVCILTTSTKPLLPQTLLSEGGAAIMVTGLRAVAQCFSVRICEGGETWGPLLMCGTPVVTDALISLRCISQNSRPLPSPSAITAASNYRYVSYYRNCVLYTCLVSIYTSFLPGSREI